MKARAVIIGGTKGLGFELAKLLRDQDYDVCITGRQNPHEPGLEFRWLNLFKINARFYEIVEDLLHEEVNLLIYAAGYLQEAQFWKLQATEIDDMINLGLRAPTQIINVLSRCQR